jgi:hypothetical protein
VIDPPPRTSPGWRRVAAFAVDYGVILAYLGLLALVGVLGRAVGVLPTEVTTPAARVVAQLAGIAVLTLPVTLWFASWEAGRRGDPWQTSARAAGRRHRRRAAGLAPVAAPDGAEVHPSVGARPYRAVEHARLAR